MQAYPTIPRSNDNKEGLTVAWRRRREVERLVLGIAISAATWGCRRILF